jgi:hypothetical protein
VRGLALLRLPVDDYLAALETLVRARSPAAAAAAGVAAVATWWVYLPVHELLHALGCVAGGGSVTRLEIDAMYGAAWLQRVFPFVAVGSRYAGQLTGFDTGGSDLTYLLTDALPYALTVLVGVPALRAAGRRPPGLAQAALFGAALPVALAPFVSLAGDYYEMGSIVVSRLAAVAVASVTPDRWRSDDLFQLVVDLRGRDPGPLDVAVVSLAALLGTALAVLTYAAGTAWARWLEGRRSGPVVDGTNANV